MFRASEPAVPIAAKFAVNRRTLVEVARHRRGGGARPAAAAFEAEKMRCSREMEQIDMRGELALRPLAARGMDMGEIVIPASLQAYLATRSDDVAGSLQKLIAACPSAPIWTPVVEPLAALAGLDPCRFDVQLLLKREGDGLSAAIVAQKWAVALTGLEAWVDVEWPSETMAIWLEGRPIRSQIDFPFLSPALTVCGSRMIGTFRRFHCRESSQDR